MARPLRKLDRKHLATAVDSLYFASENPLKVLKYFDKLKLIQNQMQKLCHVKVRRYDLLNFAVQDIIASEIELALIEHRKSVQSLYLYPHTIETIQKAKEAIIDDIRTDCRPLTAWSLLYHVHVRTEFGLSYSSFSEIAGMNVRTTNRYKNLGIDLLLQRFIRHELEIQKSALSTL
ncbi:MAG: hypothetical protein AAFY41_07255 [Bacteroidota bacterium]